MAWVQKRVLTSGTSYRVGWRDPNGKIRSKTFKGNADARAFAREVERSKDLGVYRDPNLGKVTLATFFRHHMNTSPSLSPKTRELYESQWRNHIEPRLGHVRLNAMRKADVKTFLASLREQGVGAPTVSAVHRLLRSVLSAAMDEERISANPASRLRLASQPRRAMHIFDASQVTTLADVVGDRFETLIYFLAYCGPRIGEAAALRVKHVDLMNRKVLIEEAVKEIQGGVITGPTKSKEKRSVALPPFLSDMLAHHLARYSDPKDPDAYVFVSARGRQLHASAFRKHVLKPALKRAGLPPEVRTHDLRHTAAAISISAGVHAKKIQEMLGHSSITVTFDTYAYMFETLHQETADLLDGVYRKAAQDAHVDVTLLSLRGAGSGEVA